MRFLHSADVHLDSPMRGLARYEGAPVDRLRGATRRAFERLVEVAIAERVAFVVIAGDLYDGDRDDYQTAMFLQRQLRTLREADVPVVIAYGNHDAANEITRRLRLPEGTHVLPHDEVGSVPLEGADAVVHGRSYPTRAVYEDLSVAYPAPVAGALNVGVLHTAVDGRPGHDPYAPCTLEGLARRGYGYWALGHVHRREHHRRDGVHLVFPGNLQGRDVGETGPKGASLVGYDDGQVRSVTHLDLAPVRWARLEPDLRGVSGVDEAIERAVVALDRLQAGGDAELHAVRVVLHVEASVHHEWLRHPERFEAQLRADAAGSDERLWLERVELRPTDREREAVPGEALAAVSDAVAALRSGADAEGRAGIARLLAGLRARFGPELGEAISLGAELLDEASLDDLLEEAEALLLAELGEGA